MEAKALGKKLCDKVCPGCVSGMQMTGDRCESNLIEYSSNPYNTVTVTSKKVAALL